MSVKHALLGLLRNRPGYPYELANRLQERLGPTWDLNSGQVSHEMKSLLTSEFVSRVGQTEQDDPEGRRQVYAITDSGRVKYEQWRKSHSKPGRIARRPLMLKIAMVDPANPVEMEETLAEIDAHEHECLEVITQLSRLRDREPPAHLAWVDRTIFRLSLNGDLAQAEAELRWVREARAEVSLLAREGVSSAGSVAERGRRRAREDVFDRLASEELLLACGGRRDED